MKPKALLLSLLAVPLLATSARADHWTFELLGEGVQIHVLTELDVVGIAWDRTTLKPLKDRKGNVVSRPYAIVVDLTRKVAADAVIDKAMKGYSTKGIVLHCYKDYKAKDGQPIYVKTIWLYDVTMRRTQQLGDPNGGVESLFLTFDEAVYVNEHGETYQDDHFTNRNHRKW